MRGTATKTYEVPAYITVRAIDERDAEEKAAALIALLPKDTLGTIALEGDHTAEEVDET